MQEAKNNLGKVIREARTSQELTQEKLAEILGVDKRTIVTIEKGEGNPTFEKLYPLISYLKIPADKIFYPDMDHDSPNFQQLLTELSSCTEWEAKNLIPAIRYLLDLLRRKNNQIH